MRRLGGRPALGSQISCFGNCPSVRRQKGTEHEGPVGTEAPAAADGRMAALFLQNTAGVLGSL